MCVVVYVALAPFAFHKVVQQHYSREVGEFIIFWCKIFPVYCTPKIIQIDSVFSKLFKIYRGGHFWDTVYTVAYKIYIVIIA